MLPKNQNDLGQESSESLNQEDLDVVEADFANTIKVKSKFSSSNDVSSYLRLNKQQTG